MISLLIDSKVATMRKTILLNDSLGQEAAIQQIKTNKGKIAMDSLRVEVRKLREKERNIFTETSAQYRSGLQKMNTIRYCIQAFVILMTITAIVALTRKQKEVVSLLQDLKLANSTLEQKVQERTKELHAANQELTAQNEEIGAQTEQISVQNEELLQLNAQKNTFLGIASHDMKSPLKRVSALLGLVNASPTATVASQKEYFNLINATVEGMNNLVGQLLDINKIEQGMQEIHREEVDVNLFSQHILATFEGQALEKDILLEFVGSASKHIIESDKVVLAQILENLVSNALKFSFSTTTVCLEVGVEEKSVKVSVRDQGPGIKESELPLLFGKFQKLSNRPTGGESSSGLGLSIVKELASRLGGSIAYESKVGEGSTFTLVLPLT